MAKITKAKMPIKAANKWYVMNLFSEVVRQVQQFISNS